jgi:hypothetical protein
LGIKTLPERLESDPKYRELYAYYLAVRRRYLPRKLLKQLTPETAIELGILYNKYRRMMRWK